MLLSTVGPFKRGASPRCARRSTPAASTSTRPASRRSSAACSTSSARRRARAGATLLPAMGYDFVPGTLAGALALEEAGDAAVRVDVGYYALGGGPQALSRGTRASLAGVALDRAFAYRGGRVRTVRSAERVRGFPVRGQGAAGDLGRRRGALHAPGRLSAAARGQRLPRLVRPARRAPSQASSRASARWRASPACARALAARRRASSPAWADPGPRRARRRGPPPTSSAPPTTRRRAARRGPPLRRRRVRLHGALPRVGGAPRRARGRPGDRRGRAARGVRPRGARGRLRRGRPRARGRPERRRAGATAGPASVWNERLPTCGA